MIMDVDAILDTFPIAEFARAVGMPERDVRNIARGAVQNAIINGGFPENVGKVMRYTIEATKDQ